MNLLKIKKIVKNNLFFLTNRILIGGILLSFPFSCRSYSNKETNLININIQSLSNSLIMGSNKIISENKKVVFTGFLNYNEKFRLLEKYIEDKLIEYLSKDDSIKVLNRRELDKLLIETNLQKSGLIATDDISKFGKILGANLIAHGRITELQNGLEISITFVNVYSTEQITLSEVIPKNSEFEQTLGLIYKFESDKAENYRLQKQKFEDEFNEKIKTIELDFQNRRLELEKNIKLEEIQKKEQLKYIELEIRNKSKILMELQRKESESKKYDDEIEKIKKEIVERQNNIEYNIVNGMSYAQVKKILKLSSMDINLRSVPCSHYSSHGTYDICWSSGTYYLTPNPVVIGIYNNKRKKFEERFAN